ncbi:hypothetical protein LCGC14_1809330 [marine sediment metagenome]|uniref:Calcineurin-like phosphoesterase domain-containing protein n=1 Tax=marine sediment metagenome TaxID=412755 RepID=A0A0F9HAC5_9ZZZZ
MYRVLAVSDNHVGSIFGMIPPNFRRSDDAVAPQNPGQRYLWRCWVDLCQRVAVLKPDVIVHVGDGIDGPQQAQRGTELSLPMCQDQKDAFVDTMRPLLASAPDATLYGIQGTEYHDGKAGGLMEGAMKDLGATPYFGLGSGKYSREVLDLELDGVVLNFSHGISVASGFYRATPVDREGIFSALAGKEGKVPKADLFVRAHAHYFVHIEHESKHGVIIPAWQLQTRFMRKNSAYRMLPSLGACYFDVYPERKREGEDPIEVHKILYGLPPFVTTKFTRRAEENGNGQAPSTA